MQTRIHAAGPTGQRSPGLDAAIAAWHAENPDTGGSSSLTADDNPEVPAEGSSASYLVSSAVTWPAGLVWSTDPDGGTAPTISGTALVSLFTLGGVTRAVMGATFPAAVIPDPEDTTVPTAGTLAASAITSSGFTLTVTGASDNEALHGTPYRFSTDNGATYSAWQAAATFNATGLDPETEYTCVHQVRDAALNVATGSSIPVETGGGSVTPLTITHTADGVAKSGAPLTWSALNIGTPSATRRIVVALSAYRGSDMTGFSDTLALTIGGVAATRHFPGIPTSQRLTTMFSAVVPTGATADIVATATMTPAGSDRFNVSVWAIDGGPSAFLPPSDSKYNNNTNNGVSLAAPTVNGSVTLLAAWSVATGQTFTWTGATAGPTTSNDPPWFTQTSASVTSSDDAGVAASVLCSGINITGSAATWAPA